MLINIKLKPCPFCGKSVDLNDPDVLYPNGHGWIEQDGYRSYHRFQDVPKEQYCYDLNCPVSSGGCGVYMSGDSLKEVIDKWQKRV